MSGKLVTILNLNKVYHFTRLTDDSSAISETALQVAMSERLSLNLIYNINWNDNPPLSAPKRISTKTSIQLGYAF